MKDPGLDKTIDVSLRIESGGEQHADGTLQEANSLCVAEQIWIQWKRKRVVQNTLLRQREVRL